MTMRKDNALTGDNGTGAMTENGTPKGTVFPAPITPAAILNEVAELEAWAKAPAAPPRKPKPANLFLIRTATQCIEDAKARPIPKMLFGEFWHEGELCILFADTNLGKSILAVQIADSISRGRAIPGFKLEAQAQPVLYFDFELSDKQFEARYSVNYEGHYQFTDSLYRLEVDPDAEFPKEFEGDFEAFLNHSLEAAIVTNGAKVLVIDNLTYLKNETEKAKDALPLMKHLKALKAKYGLSILALAHTPKRDLSKAINRNDLQGSKMLINFCDSCFAIGESHTDRGARYLKQIKARNTEIMYDGDNVCICQIVKAAPDNFLRFEFMSYGAELEHLRTPSQDDREAIIAKVVELKDKGRTHAEVSAELKIATGTVTKYYKLGTGKNDS